MVDFEKVSISGCSLARRPTPLPEQHDLFQKLWKEGVLSGSRAECSREGRGGKPELRRMLPKGYLIGGPKMSVGAPHLFLIVVIFGVEGMMNLAFCRRNSIHRAFSRRDRLEPCKLCFCEQS